MKRLALAAHAAAMLALCIAATAAHGYSAEISPAGEIALASLGKLSFVTGEIGLRCNLTLTGELAETAELVPGAVLGEITAVEWSGCEGGNWRAFLGLPWDITISSVLGSLPDAMTGLLLAIEDFALQWSVFGGFVNCLWIGDLGALLAVSGTNPYTSDLLTLLGNSLLKGSGSLCPESIRVIGTLALSPEQTITVS